MGHFGGGGWGGHGMMGRGMMVGGPQRLRGGLDGWDDEEYGTVYNHRVVARLLGYLRPFKGRVGLALIGMVVYVGAARFQPLIIGNLVDAAGSGNISGVNRNGATFLVLALVAWATLYMQLLNTGWVGHRVLFTLRTQLFNHLQKLSLRFYDKNEVGRVMSRVTSDVVTLQELLTNGFITNLADFGGLILVIALMLPSQRWCT